jgi:hypothetical protein
VIFISAQDQDSLQERASLIPNSAYLRKPFVGSVLLETMHALLKDCSNGAH